MAQLLLVDGVGAGVVIGFLPTIVTLFFFLSILEDSDYTARGIRCGAAELPFARGRKPARYFPISSSTSPSSDSTRAARMRPASSSRKPTDAGNPPRGRLQLPGQMNRLAGYASRPVRSSGMWVWPCTHTCGSGSPGAIAREPLKPMRTSLG